MKMTRISVCVEYEKSIFQLCKRLKLLRKRQFGEVPQSPFSRSKSFQQTYLSLADGTKTVE